ncbi:MAG: hypothetical protein KC729_15435 [Candidatus Eisenbacteria bacterium]|uniref:Uncharacterized protein n=1 Tax=Eiseniibacteriota bacterium TaxID=2212470 RepID=A0A956M167_UNCEI|nr:hypothetical protein [Candidatus Eisenbacteria bacterium]
MGFRPGTRRVTAVVALTLMLAGFAPPLVSTAHAEDASTPLLTIAKSSLLGGLVGLVLGGVTALVVDSDKRDDSVRWGIVLGTFGGFAYGIYAVSQHSDDDFFGARETFGTETWTRPLPGAARTERFAGLDTSVRTSSIPSVFRANRAELVPVDSAD